MEGPSLFLAAEQLAPFIGSHVIDVEGNSKIGIELLVGKKVLSIFSYGKTLNFQFDTFALRVHFLLFGSFEAFLNDKSITGDYPRKERPIRLSLKFKNGRINMFSCSLKFVEGGETQKLYDYSKDIMSSFWDEKKAVRALRQQRSDIADALLDQEIFLGVGNIIKNEVLFRAKISPLTKVEELSNYKIKKLVKLVREYVFQFYEWRKKFELRKHYQIYRQRVCKKCGDKVSRKKTGARQRLSYFCPHCQKFNET